jgi:hypothetical protein
MMTGLRIGRLTAIGSMVLICTPATSVVRAPAVVEQRRARFKYPWQI